MHALHQVVALSIALIISVYLPKRIICSPNTSARMAQLNVNWASFYSYTQLNSINSQVELPAHLIDVIKLLTCMLGLESEFKVAAKLLIEDVLEIRPKTGFEAISPYVPQYVKREVDLVRLTARRYSRRHCFIMLLHWLNGHEICPEP